MGGTTATDNPRALDNGGIIFADGEARALLAGIGEELSHPEGRNWHLVKGSVSRTVYRGRVGRTEIYLKHYHSRSLMHRIARRMGSGDAKREMRFCRYLASHGVATAPVLALMCRDGVEWLATRAVAPALAVDKWHVQQLSRGAEGRKAIQQAIGALARMVGRMHAAGVIHGDLHCGNVLVRTDAGRGELVLMDLHRVRRRRRLSRRARAANLAQLMHDRYEFTTRSERLRFLKHYLSTGGASGSVRGWQLMVEDFARRHRRRQYAKRDRRIFGRNRYFAPLKLPRGWRGHVVLASKRSMAGSRAAALTFDASAWREALARPEALFEDTGGRIVKSSASTVILRRRLMVGEHEVEIFIKRPRRKRAWKVLVDCFRRARPIRAFRMGHALLTRRIATALPLACLERRIGPFLLDSILITEATDALGLDEFLNTWLARHPAGAPKLTAAGQWHLAQQMLWQLGKLVQRLHDNNFAHRDLKAPNLLARWSPGEIPEVVLVDLDGLKSRRFMTAHRRFQGLMRLNVSLLKCPAVTRAGRLRMLMGYLRRPGCGRIDFKPYWYLLARWSAKKLKQQIRSRRKRQKTARRPA